MGGVVLSSCKKSAPAYRREAVTVSLNGFVVNKNGVKGIRNAMSPLMKLKADLESGKLKREQVPDYVFDILEYPGIDKFPANGESGKIYVDDETNRIFRWAGVKYVELASPESEGYYRKPEDGIPEQDLAQAVQLLLGKADTAIQEHQQLLEVFIDGKLREYILGDQDDKPIMPSRVLAASEDPTVGEIAEALGWGRQEQQEPQEQAQH